MSGIINSAGSRSGVIGFSGDIVASGSNSNGYYIKYSDGTMICRYKVTNDSDRVSCTTVLNASGEIIAYYGYKDFTYPVAFVGTATITMATASCVPSSANTVASVESYLNETTIRISVWADRSTSTAGKITYVAIGKWK